MAIHSYFHTSLSHPFCNGFDQCFIPTINIGITTRTNNSQIFESELKDYLVDQYNLYRSENKERMQEIERWLILETIDKGWNQHMLNIDHLKEGINLRSWGQKNPLIEYKREAFLTFQDMLTSIKWEIVHHVFHLNVENFNQQELMKKREIDFAKINLNMPEDKVEKITKSKK